MKENQAFKKKIKISNNQIIRKLIEKHLGLPFFSEAMTLEQLFKLANINPVILGYREALVFYLWLKEIEQLVAVPLDWRNEVLKGE